MTGTGVQQGLIETRRSLHAVAELVLAGPQYAASGTIRLRVVPGGFATTADPDLTVRGTSVVAPGRAPVGIDGRTGRDLASAVGVEARSLSDLYSDGPGVTSDQTLAVDERATVALLEALALGDAGLRLFAPDSEPVLWPEHFDLGVTIDEVNYGVSPGDAHVAEPYAYVGPWAAPPLDDFWTHPFGAVRLLSALPDAGSVQGFFDEGRSRALPG